MIDPRGKTMLNVPPVGAAAGPRDEHLFAAVRDAVAGSYELLGELGRGRQGSIVYLVRDLANSQLVALKLDRTPGTEAEYSLTVAEQLDESIPSPGAACPFCQQHLAGWVQFCVHCGRDVSGIDSGVSGFTSEQLLAAVREAAEGSYDVLGEMPRARGGGVVYFARDLETQAIVALRLQHDDANEQFSLGRTQVLQPIVESMGAEYASPTMLEAPGAAAPPPRPPATAPPPTPTPAPPAAAVAATPPPASPPPPKPRAAIAAFRTEVVSSLPAPSAGEAPPAESAEDIASAPAPATSPVGSRRRFPIIAIAGAAAVLVAAAVAMATLGGDAESDLDVGTVTPPADSSAPVVTTPPPVEAPPTPRPAQAVLVIGRLPSGARVLVDGATLRERTVVLAPGRHTLMVRAPGYETIEESRVLGADTTRWAPQMRRIVVQAPPPPPKSDPVPPTTPPVERATCASTTSAQEWPRARTLCADEATTGNVTAQRRLALLMLRGQGGAVDEKGGVHWLRIASDADDTESLFELARVHQTRRGYRDDAQAYRLFRRAAAKGHAESQYQAGRALERGLGTSRNLGEAFLWYEQAAKQNHPLAQTAAGVFLKKGQGVRRDDRKALEWLTRATQGGSADAHFHLGELHEEGRAGLAKSRSAARDWYQKGATLGSEEAKRALARLR